MIRWSCSILLGLLIAFSGVAPARAARPIVDLHRLDAYFALFARDSNVPWEPTAVRLDTYSSAPVQFTAYSVDPSAVIVAGAGTRPRAIDTRRAKRVASWEFTPPGGYQFQSSMVNVPLGSREGFFVVEARRGNVGEQVWINRSRIGLLTKETPAGMLLYGADLGTGAALSKMRVSFLVNGRFDVRSTDASGLIRWNGNPRPIFALARWGESNAFVSFLPQPPLPSTVVGVALDSAVVHAGDALHVVGFARSRAGSKLRAARGTVDLRLRLRGETAARTTLRLDRAGAFHATLQIPKNARAGDYAVVATTNGGTAGASVHVDADAGGLALSVAAACAPVCSSSADIPLVVKAERSAIPAANVPLNVEVVRSPHIIFGQAAQATPWGITRWLESTIRTDSSGEASVSIPRPTDGLASTYGVRVSSGAATADTRVVVPTSSIVLRVALDRDEQSVGTPVAFDVDAQDAATGKPASGVRVTLQLMHGASVQQQALQLNALGHARGSFSSAQIGSNLVIASAPSEGGAAMDAQQVQVVPQALQQTERTNSGDVAISLDRSHYSAGEPVRANAALDGAHGDALLTFESALGTQTALVAASGGRAKASLRALDAPGALSVGAALVTAGTLRWSTMPLAVDGPGRPEPFALRLDREHYAPGSLAKVSLESMRSGSGTFAVRVASGVPSGSALFASAPQLLAIDTTSSQDSAPAEPAWHPWVDSTGNHAQIITFAQRGSPPQDLTLADSDTRNLYWKVDRSTGGSLAVPVPSTPGTYTLSVLKISDDGAVSAGAADLVVGDR
ncbi:MAG: hypothetical protein M3R35_05250 [Candidatus Eremiobacteraeota bacterium]|nr:hypothetical protein [Candidatus Eremiobacteraeota bacterium]